MKPDYSQADKLKKAKDSVKVAELNSVINAALPYLGIRERILKQAMALIPVDIPNEYKKVLETQFALVIQTTGFYNEFQVIFKKIEDDIWRAFNESTKEERKKASNFIKEKGPLKILEEWWPTLVDLRYEYFTRSALKILRRARLYKQRSPIFEGSIILTSAFNYAMLLDDLDFFAQVGDVLRKRQENQNSVISNVTENKLQSFLLKHWAEKINDVPPLYNLSMKQLLKVCGEHLNNRQLSLDAVEKTRQRLGLKTVRRVSLK